MATDNKTGEKAMPKTEIFKKLAEKTGLEPKQVGSVFEALEELAKEVLAKKNGPGEFLVPGLVKLKLVKKAATKAGTRSVAGRMVEVKAKPASVKVKPVVLKGLKELNK
jgi:nucleoid DNA-binding protein